MGFMPEFIKEKG